MKIRLRPTSLLHNDETPLNAVKPAVWQELIFEGGAAYLGGWLASRSLMYFFRGSSEVTLIRAITTEPNDWRELLLRLVLILSVFVLFTVAGAFTTWFVFQRLSASRYRGIAMVGAGVGIFLFVFEQLSEVAELVGRAFS